MRTRQWYEELRDLLLNPDNTARRAAGLFKRAEDRVTPNTVVGIINRSQKAWELGRKDDFRSVFTQDQWTLFMSIRAQHRGGGGHKRPSLPGRKAALDLAEDTDESPIGTGEPHPLSARKPSRRERLEGMVSVYVEPKADATPTSTCQYAVDEVSRGKYVFCPNESTLSYLGGKKTDLPLPLQKLKPDMILHCCPHHAVRIVNDKAMVRALLEKAGIPAALFKETAAA